MNETNVYNQLLSKSLLISFLHSLKEAVNDISTLYDFLRLYANKIHGTTFFFPKLSTKIHTQLMGKTIYLKSHQHLNNY